MDERESCIERIDWPGVRASRFLIDGKPAKGMTEYRINDRAGGLYAPSANRKHTLGLRSRQGCQHREIGYIVDGLRSPR